LSRSGFRTGGGGGALTRRGAGLGAIAAQWSATGKNFLDNGGPPPKTVVVGRGTGAFFVLWARPWAEKGCFHEAARSDTARQRKAVGRPWAAKNLDAGPSPESVAHGAARLGPRNSAARGVRAWQLRYNQAATERAFVIPSASF